MGLPDPKTSKATEPGGTGTTHRMTGVWIQVRFCQCQNCIYCHGGCGDPAVMALLLAADEPDFTREVAVCEHCGICLLAAHPTEFQKVHRPQASR